jgi:hypothetical protein
VTGAAAVARARAWSCTEMRWREHPGHPAGDTAAAGVPGAEWTPCRALLEPGSPHLDDQLRVVGERQGATRLSVRASLLLERYAWALAAAAFTCVLTERRLPDLAAGRLAVRVDAGGFVDAVLSLEPDLRPVPAPGRELEALRPGLLDGHLLPLVERLLERGVHRGRNALRCLVLDALAAGAASAAEATGGSAGEAAALAAGAGDLLGVSAALRPRILDVDGRLVRRRAVCCLLHTEAGSHCATCPHLAEAETVRRTRGPGRR